MTHPTTSQALQPTLCSEFQVGESDDCFFLNKIKIIAYRVIYVSSDFYVNQIKSNLCKFRFIRFM